MMKKAIIALFALLIASAAFAGYPEEYYGPPLPEGCIEIEAYIPEGGFLDRYPWSMPSPEEVIFWWGTLCVEGDVAVIEFTDLGSRVCRENAWGSRDDVPSCYGWHKVDIHDPDRYVIPWDPDFEDDWGFYIAQVWNGDVWLYNSVTNNDDGSMTFVQGGFDFVSPLWFIESDDYSRWTFKVKPKTSPVYGQTRIVTGRAGNVTN